ncbi:MAG: hypothetical protein ABL903_04510 [Methylococcales bacterium]
MAENYIKDSEPFDPEFISRIEMMVRAGDALIASPSTIQDAYSLEEYIIRGANTSLNVLLDTNILTRLIHLAKGIEINESEKEIYQNCCAVMCFFILGKFQVEPNIAVYEKASKNGHSNALNDYRNFMIANHIHPLVYAKLAFGQINKIDTKQIQYTKETINIGSPEESDFAKKLNDWKLIYLSLLKAKTLLKAELERTEKFKSMMEWFVSQSSTTPEIIVFIIFLFSPRASNKIGKMINDIKSPDFEIQKEGLKNTAWDLTFLTEWDTKCRSQPKTTVWFFCTHDKVLEAIARYCHPKQVEDKDITLQNLITDYWGKSEGKKVYSHYKEMEKAISSNIDNRRDHNRTVWSNIDKMIEDLELELQM